MLPHIGRNLWKRRELKPGAKPPVDFEVADYDAVTGKTVGWVPVTDADKWHHDALKNAPSIDGKIALSDGTYELCGPKIQSNPEGCDIHYLISHANADQFDVPVRTFDAIREFLEHCDIEGLVFHHPDGRMAKIKKRDYGLKR